MKRSTTDGTDRGWERIAGRNPVTLASTLDDLATVRGTVDLVHSTLVFQHIRSKRGLRIFADLVAMLAPGGCGAVQVHLGRRAHRLRRAVSSARGSGCRMR